MFDFAGYLKRRIGYNKLHSIKPTTCCKCTCRVHYDTFKPTDTSRWSSDKLREEAEKAVQRLRDGY